jgi:hypothetical protein
LLRKKHKKNGTHIILVYRGFVQTNLAFNTLTAIGTPEAKKTEITDNGMTLFEINPKMIR